MLTPANHTPHQATSNQQPASFAEMSARQSLPRKAKSKHTFNPSLLQRQIEQAINSPGGINKVYSLIQQASNKDIETLNDHQWSPLIGSIFRLGKESTRHGNSNQSELELRKMIQLCHRKRLSLDSGSYFAAHFHRPLTVAAYFGFHLGVRTLLELGASPDLTDGEGKTAWHTSFDNPCFSSNAIFRECDKHTARVMIEMGAVTSDKREWKRRNVGSQAGSLSYVNRESKVGSPLYRALQNKRVEVVKFIVDSGGVISDREFITLYRRKEVKRLLLRMVKILQKRNTGVADYLDWSFPPSWKAAVNVATTQWEHRGLPPNMFQLRVVPFLANRDWFFSHQQLHVLNIPVMQSATGKAIL